MLNQQVSIKDETSLSASIIESCTEYSIIATDLDAKIIAWNEGARRLFDYDPSEMIGKASLADINNPEDVLSGKSQQILEAAGQDGLWSGELKYIAKGGKPVFVLSTVTLRTNSLGEPLGYTIIAHDQTEFSNKLKALTESKEYTRSLIESNIDVLVTTDSFGIITDVNRQFCELAEMPLKKLIGSPFKMYFTDTKRAEDLIRKVLSANRIANYELVIKSVNNKLTPLSFNVATFHTIDGHLKGIFTTARDITEQKRLEEQTSPAVMVPLEVSVPPLTYTPLVVIVVELAMAYDPADTTSWVTQKVGLTEVSKCRQPGSGLPAW